MATLTHLAEPGRASGVVRIVIADSHAMFRAALKRLLPAEPDFHVIAEAEDGIEAIAIVREARPHVVLLDLELPRCSGLDALREIRNASPPTLPLLLVDTIDDEQLIEAFCLGARGVALKTTATDLLFKSIRAVVAGEYWLERNRFPLLIRALNNRLHSRGQDNCHNVFGLNQRELELVAAIADGESTRDLAEKFSLSEVTVRHRLTNIFRKLHVRNRGELLSFAMRHDLGSNGYASRRLTATMQSRNAD
jgi:two-component system nitrate/nitrite response regulator NarL